MKNFYKYSNRQTQKYELLSAYLDNELSNDDVKKLEDELKFSIELQDKLAELKKIKQLTISSVKSIPENPFFETRLAAIVNIKDKWYHGLKKFSPVFGVIALSVVLMIVLRYNPKLIDNVVEQQKSKLATFYKQNLKPLLYTANLTNEDIFNFAFSRQLPLDSQKKQCLQLGTDKNGSQFFEIKNAGIAQNVNNLEQFKKGLNLNTRQQKQLDSILASYAPGLQAQVLVNEKNTVAINPNIWNYNNALTADLISFASKINKRDFQNVVPPDYRKLYDPRAIARMIREAKSAKSNNYIFFTQDSIFSDKYYFNPEEFSKEMKRWSEEMQKNMRDFDKQFSDLNLHFGDNFSKLKKDSSWDRNFRVLIDSNICRVHIPKIEIPPINIPNMDNFNLNLDSLSNYIRSFSFNLPKHGKNYKYFYSDSSKGFKFKAFGFDSTFTFKNQKIDSVLQNKFKNFNFRFNPDSLASIYKFFLNDSSSIESQKEMQNQMKEFEKQMQQFQKEMEEMQKQLKKNPTKTQKKKTVEI